MRLVEFFLILEAKDRLQYLADKYASKIHKKWEHELDNKLLNTLPQSWLSALGSSRLPSKSAVGRDWNVDFPDMAKWVVDWFATIDPTPNNKYTDWMLRQWLGNFIELEDVYKMEDYLTVFDEHRKNLEKKDINQYKNYRELVAIVYNLKGKQAAGEKVKNFFGKRTIQQMMDHPVPDPQKTFGEKSDSKFAGELDDYITHSRNEGKEFDTANWYGSDWSGVPETPEEDPNSTTEIEVKYRSDRLAVLIPNTKRAACELGSGTEWCTAASYSHNAFWHYAADGSLYVILTDKMGKFQFHFPSDQFADVHDNMLTDENKLDLVNAYPELTEVFHDEAVNHGQLWLIDPDKITPDLVSSMIDEVDRQSPSYNSNQKKFLMSLPITFDGKVDEEILLTVESWLREYDSVYSWKYIRPKNRTEADFFASLNTKSQDIRSVDPSVSIIQYATDNDLQLSEELYEALVARNGETLLYIPIDIIERNPQWLLGAIQNQPRIIEYIYTTLTADDKAYTYTMSAKKARFFHKILSTPEGIKAVSNSLYEDPLMVKEIGSLLGIEPWKAAFYSARNNIKTAASLAFRLSARFTNNPIDFPRNQMEELLLFVLNNVLLEQSPPHNTDVFESIVHTLREFEKAIGRIPVKIQQIVLQRIPIYIQYLKNPEPDILQASIEMVGQQ